MKKYSIILTAFLLAVSPVVHAQTADTPRTEQRLTLSGGPILESNLSGFFHSGVDGGNCQMRAGVSAGGFLDLGIRPSFSVQGTLLFHLKRSDFEWDGQTGEFRYVGAEFAVHALYHFHLRSGAQFIVGLGPYTEFGFDATLKRNGVKSNLYEKDTDTGLPILRDSNTGFAVKVGYELACGLQLNATYKASVTNLLDANSSTVKMYPHAVSVGVAYRFGK